MLFVVISKGIMGKTLKDIKVILFDKMCVDTCLVLIYKIIICKYLGMKGKKKC